jgi:hypothetical protein
VPGRLQRRDGGRRRGRCSDGEREVDPYSLINYIHALTMSDNERRVDPYSLINYIQALTMSDNERRVDPYSLINYIYMLTMSDNDSWQKLKDTQNL